MRNKILFITLAMVLILSTCGAALAVQIQPYYVSITSAQVALGISGGLASCSAILNVNNGVDNTRIDMYLQRSSGGSWTTISSWSKTASGDTSLYTSKSVSSGYSYRLKVVFTADTEVVTKYSYYTY